MSDELRMDLADCGSPEALISVILKHHPHWTPPVPLESLARTVGIVDFKDMEVDGFEGALMTDADKSRGVILTKKGARDERRRFTVAHELGHFLIPSHRGNQQCTAADLRENRRNDTHRRQEAEANRFAAGLLMPRPWFTRDMEKLGDADVTHAQKLAKKYGTSLQATANRYVELTDDICAFIFSKDGVISSIRQTKDFPRLAVKKGDALPQHCSSLKAPALPLRVATGWVELDGVIWLETVWEKPAPMVLEQSVRQKGGFQVTLLFITAETDSDGEEEDEIGERWAVRFHQR